MDDYSIKNLIESKNEWCLRLLNIFTPCIIHGFNTILDEAYKLCIENNEYNKYLITFQNLLSRVPKWNNQIIEDEKNRIINVSNCKYIEDLITCVHILHLKALTCMRVGQKQKKINLDIPSLDKFVHNVYINSARKLYVNVYLFEKNISPLEIQKNKREIELIIKECIMNTIQDSVPVEDILSKYLSESLEEDCDVTEEVIETPIIDNKETLETKPVIDKPVIEAKPVIDNIETLEEKPVIDNIETLEAKPVIDKPVVKEKPVIDNIETTPVIDNIETTSVIEEKPVIDNIETLDIKPVIEKEKTFEKLNFKKPIFNENANDNDDNINNKINFDNIDETIDTNGNKENVFFSKDINNLEGKMKGIYGNIEDEFEDDDEGDDNDKLVIGSDIKLDYSDINNLNNQNINIEPIKLDVEVL